MIFELDKDKLLFPDPSLAEADGLLAIGGDLSTERLLLAYNNGIFPWFSEGDRICWYSPHERCVIFPNKVITSKSMSKLLKKNIFEIRLNTVFEEVIENCKTISRKDQDGTWITDEMKEAYLELYKDGVAKSIEVWQSNKLVGGMYGLEINEVFCGESMFSKVSNASKAAVIWLCKSNRYKLLDCQIPNEHLLSLGATLISQENFLEILHTKTAAV
ncbi:MAG: leucyl/phenylalanyl-tRNA--protein transferase [Ferruginibacter sp.]